jgi:hypothetical protein
MTQDVGRQREKILSSRSPGRSNIINLTDRKKETLRRAESEEG